MKTLATRHTTRLWSLMLPFALALTLSGCTLLGLGAAAGAGAGGCALLDENNDNRVTSTELSRGLFDDWDTNDNGTLTEAEFEAGVDQRATFDDWSGNFDDWDTSNDGTLTEAEFEAGVVGDENTANWLDNQCDSLGL